MVRNFLYIFFVMLIVSCGSSKKTAEANKKTEQAILEKKDTVSETVEKIEVLDEGEEKKVLDVVKEVNDTNEIIDEKTSQNTALVSDSRIISNVSSIDKNLVYTETSNTSPSLIDKVIWSAVGYKGVPYKYGGASKSGMDCSGLIYKSFKERGVTVPRRSVWMYEKGYAIPLDEAKKGDLLFFKIDSKESNEVVNHVGIVSSNVNGNVKFIHSIKSRGVVLSNLSESYWSNAFIEAKRIVE